jgi:manganese efflux pump family protein
MKWAALILWLATAGGGFIMLGIWLKNGGMAQARLQGARIRPPLLFSHFLLAATGLVLWIIYVANDDDTIKWIAFALLLVVALLGFAMLGIWLSRRRAPVHAQADGPDALPAEQRFPTAIVALHGVAAATTLVLVFLTNIGVGD